MRRIIVQLKVICVKSGSRGNDGKIQNDKWNKVLLKIDWADKVVVAQVAGRVLENIFWLWSWHPKVCNPYLNHPFLGFQWFQTYSILMILFVDLHLWKWMGLETEGDALGFAISKPSSAAGSWFRRGNTPSFQSSLFIHHLFMDLQDLQDLHCLSMCFIF